ARERTSLYSGFVQDEIALWGDRVSLALGTKLEHNAYTGMEIEPGVRLGWNISPHQSVWAAVSRAVRTPSRRDRDLLGLNVGVLPSESLPMPVPFPVQLVVNGNKDHQDEVLLAHEIGYRVQPSRTVSLDFAGFFNRYHNVQGEFIETPILRMAPQPYFLLPAYFAAALKMHSFGAELAASWDVLPAWKLSAGYSWLNMSWGKDREDCWPMEARGADPHHQFNVRSYLDLPQRFSLDATASFSGRVAPYSGPAEAPVPAYLRTGLQVTRRFANGFEVSFAADDLTNGRHLEYQPETFGQGSLIGRSAYVRVAWRSLQ
ncbi:MAG: TonB-dependent receptor, partial [Acidobacteria bacterium]|nr:TonB-dependent receptor [Acidobacteriota bacterium]